MCTRNCLCNSCHKKKTCSDCPFINKQDTSNNSWSLICSSTGIQTCEYYIKPPEIYHELEEDPIIIKFKNGSNIETVETKGSVTRGKMHDFQYEDISEYVDYMKRHPYKFVELYTGIKLHPWQRLYLRLLDSDLVRRINRYKRQ